MNDQEKRSGNKLGLIFQAVTALGSIVTAFVLLVAVAQYWQSEKQNMSNAAITFIQIHNNDDFYDARRDILNAIRTVNSNFQATQSLTQEEQVYLDNLGKDFLIAQQRAGKSYDPIEELNKKYDAIGLALIQLYDAVGKCVNDNICLYDTSVQHFQGMARMILLSFESNFSEWGNDFNNLGKYACALAEGRIKDQNRQATVLDALTSLFDFHSAEPEGQCGLIRLNTTS